MRAATDKQSLTIAGGTAKSPQFCVDSTMPYIRFFARQSVRGGGLRVSLVLQGGTTVSGSNNIKIVEFADGSMPNWAATGQLPVSVALQVPVGSSVQASLLFQTMSGTGAWQIDDVYVDPFRTG